MALLATQVVSLTGLEPVFASAAGGGDTFEPGDTTYIEVINGAGADMTVTIDSKVPSNYGTDVNPAVVVTAGERRKIGPLPAQRFAGSTGVGNITYSSATSVTVGVFR